MKKFRASPAEMMVEVGLFGEWGPHLGHKTDRTQNSVIKLVFKKIKISNKDRIR